MTSEASEANNITLNETFLREAWMDGWMDGYDIHPSMGFIEMFKLSLFFWPHWPHCPIPLFFTETRKVKYFLKTCFLNATQLFVS